MSVKKGAGFQQHIRREQPPAFIAHIQCFAVNLEACPLNEGTRSGWCRRTGIGPSKVSASAERLAFGFLILLCVGRLNSIMTSAFAVVRGECRTWRSPSSPASLPSFFIQYCLQLGSRISLIIRPFSWQMVPTRVELGGGGSLLHVTCLYGQLHRANLNNTVAGTWSLVLASRGYKFSHKCPPPMAGGFGCRNCAMPRNAEAARKSNVDVLTSGPVGGIASNGFLLCSRGKDANVSGDKTACIAHLTTR